MHRLIRRSLQVTAAVSAASFIVRRLRAIDFAGRTIVISGGSRGLGLELARLFAAEGARLALLARDAGELERAARLDPRGSAADAPARRANRQHRFDRRQSRPAASVALLFEQICVGWFIQRRARRTLPPRDWSYHRLSRPHAHRVPRKRMVQRT